MYCLFSFLLFAFLLSVILTACSDGGGGGSAPVETAQNPSGDSGQGLATFLPNNLLGFVADPDDTLIPFAMLGGASTGSTGITTDAATATAAGWYAVEANGYATGYTQAGGQLNGVTILTATLTPVDTEAFHPVGGDTIVDVGPADAPLLTVTLTPGEFVEDAIIEVTVLDPGLLETTYAPMNTTDLLYINLPFEIRARSAVDGSLLQPVSGQVVDVTIADGGALGDPPRLFWFDPEQGQWLEQSDAACSRVDADHVSCQLTHFSQHGGGGSAPPPPSGKGSTHARASAATDAAYHEAAKDVAADDEAGLCDVFTPEVVAAFMAEANNHPSEAAKKMLTDTAGRLQLTGGFNGDGESGCDVFPPEWPHAPDPYEALWNAVEDVTKKLAADLLINPQCPDLDAINKVLGEADLVGIRDVDPIPALETKYYELLDQCNIWEGRVEYSILLPKSTMPNVVWYSGPRYWTEYHDISLVQHTSAFTEKEDFGSFDGTDKVEADFTKAEYREEEAGCTPTMYAIEDSLWGEPGNGAITVTLTGQVDPQQGFVPENATASNSINLRRQYLDRQIGWSGETGCYVSSEDIAMDLNYPYLGQIAEKTPPPSGQPVIFMNDQWEQFPSLWEILNREPTSSLPGGIDSYPQDFYRGTEILNDVLIPFGLPDMRVVMRWSLVHTDYTKGR